MRRNIVLIGADSIRADHCRCYGYHRDTTPFLDSLAEGGVKFENPIVSGLATPTSFMGLFTGDYSPVETQLIKPQEWEQALTRRKTLAQVLTKNAYNTYGFNTNVLLSRYYGFNKGFQHYYDGLWNQGKEHRHWWKMKKFFLLPLLLELGLARPAINLKNFLLADIGYSRAEEWIGNILNVSLDEPYFLWVFLVDTHHPYVPTREYAQWGEINARRMIWLNYKMRRQGRGEIASRQMGRRIDEKPGPEMDTNLWNMAQQKMELKLSQKEHQSIVNGYDGSILHVDSVIKLLWEHLKHTNPIFIFHSDHGDGLGEHGFYGHPPEVYEYLIKVPLIIYNAGRKGAIERPVSLLSLAPTICELAEAENEFGHPSLFDDTVSSPPIVENWVGKSPRLAVRDKEWKLIVNPDRGDELYNIKEDSLETRNLIGEEKDPERRLRQIAEDHAKGKRETIEKAKVSGKVRKLKTLGKI